MKFYQAIITLGKFLQPILLLALRLYWGYSFMTSGWGKLHNISEVATYFESLHIPFPVANAYLVGYVELIGGFCLLVGFAARLMAIPLIINMIVALITAHREAVANIFNDFQNVINQTPFSYLLVSLIILAFGPGLISVDALLKSKVFDKSKGNSIG